MGFDFAMQRMSNGDLSALRSGVRTS